MKEKMQDYDHCMSINVKIISINLKYNLRRISDAAI